MWEESRPSLEIEGGLDSGMLNVRNYSSSTLKTRCVALLRETRPRTEDGQKANRLSSSTFAEGVSPEGRSRLFMCPRSLLEIGALSLEVLLLVSKGCRLISGQEASGKLLAVDAGEPGNSKHVLFL